MTRFQTGLTLLLRLPFKSAEVAEVAGSPKNADIPNIVRSPVLPPEIAGITKIAGREWVIACWDIKKWRGSRRDYRYCWDCRPKVPRSPRLLEVKRMPNFQTETAKIETEIMGRYCGDCRDCWDWRECRYWQDCRDRRNFRPRLPGAPILQDQNGWLHAEIEKSDEVAGRVCWHWRDCRPKMPRLSGLLRVTNFQSKISKYPGQDCWDCNGDCRPTLERLQRLLDVPRMQIFPGLATLPRLSPEIAGITDNACREWVIECSDWTKLTKLPAGIAGTAQVAAQRCRGCRGCWEWWECRVCRQRLPRLRWSMSGDIAESGEIAGISENADNGKIAEIAQTVARDSWDYRCCRPRMGDCTLRLKKSWRACWTGLPVLPL